MKKQLILEKEKKIEEPESIQINIPSYFKKGSGAIMITKSTIVLVYPDFLATYSLTYDNFKQHCNGEPCDRNTFLIRFNATVSLLNENISDPSIFDELKNDEEYYDETEMTCREEEYFYQQENSKL